MMTPCSLIDAASVGVERRDSSPPRPAVSQTRGHIPRAAAPHWPREGAKRRRTEPGHDPVRVGCVTDAPPADWYTDPEDESQYRYWDGSAWTDHRAPRLTDPDDEPDGDSEALRGPGELIGDSFSLGWRQRKGFALAALMNVAGQVLVVLLGYLTADRVLGGELAEIWERITDPGFDPESPEQEAYFEALEFDFSVASLAPLVIAVLVAWVAYNVSRALVMRLTLSDLRGQPVQIRPALSKSLARVPRLMGVDLQLGALVIAAGAVIAAAAFVAPVLLLVLIPAFLAALILTTAVLPLAYAVAAVGPSRASLPYAWRLVRGRFWKALGRLLLVTLVVFAVSFGVGIVFGVTSLFAEQLWVLSQVIQAAVGAALAVVVLTATAILYDDLGGESD